MAAVTSTITRWHFVRHAPVDQSASVLYATADEPANVSDTAAFRDLAAFLPAGALWVTSHLQRAVQTADAILAQSAGLPGGPPVRRWIDRRLAEQDYGRWHGLDRAGLQSALAGRPFHKMWLTTAQDIPPDGESFIDQARRVAAAMDEITAANTGAAIVAVAHGGTIRAAMAHALGLDLNRALTISVDNLSTTRIDHVPGPGIGGDWRLVYTNRRAG